MRSLQLTLVAAAGLVLGLPALAPAQLRPGDATPLGGEEDARRFDANTRIQLDRYLTGKQQPGSEAKKVLELAARVYIYRLTWLLPQKHPELMEKSRAEFRREIGLVLQAEKDNREAVRQWSPMLVSTFKDVFALPADKNRLAAVNAALLLPDLARLREPVIADFLVDLVKDNKKSEFVRFWAAKALKEIPPATEYIAINITKEGKAAEKRKAVDLRRVQALTALFDRQWVAPPQKLNERKEDYQKRVKEYEDGFRWVRQGAIEGLAQVRIPAVEANIKTKKVIGAVAPIFLRVLAKDSGLNPEPSLHEKLEAAIGICQIKVDPNSIYQPEEGIHRIGTFLVELGNVYVADYNVSFNKGTWVMTWKVHGKRLQAALSELVQSVTNNTLHQGAAENARKLEKAAQHLLQAIQTQRPFTLGAALAADVNGLRPTSNQIFKGIPPQTGNTE